MAHGIEFPPVAAHTRPEFQIVSQVATRATRAVYARELLPERALWWLAAAGMRDWYRILGKKLEPHLPNAKKQLAEHGIRLFERRRAALPSRIRERLEAPRDLALLLGALYRIDGAPKSAWIFEGIGGAAKTIPERLRARLLLSRMTVRERWDEVATHLGELLIVLTEDLPAILPHARKILGDICFEAGAKYAEHAKKLLHFPERSSDPPRDAMEILRMSEYVFQVNPEHWGSSDGTSGWLEGTACPWWSRPGWNGGHCGIFGQFQSGIASAFGLRYHLSKTIPKHGGHTCRIDVKPIQDRRADAPLVPASDLTRRARVS